MIPEILGVVVYLFTALVVGLFVAEKTRRKP